MLFLAFLGGNAMLLVVAGCLAGVAAVCLTVFLGITALQAIAAYYALGLFTIIACLINDAIRDWRTARANTLHFPIKK